MNLRRSFLMSGIDRYLTLAVNLGVMAALARLLTPDEVGAFVVGAAVVMVAEALRDFGASSYLVQAQDVSCESVRTTFTVMAGMAVVVTILLNVGAEPLAVYYADTRIASVIRIASMTVILNAVAAPALALWRRDLAFGTLAVINLCGVVGNAVASLLLAAFGWGYLSLALGTLSGSAASAAAATLHRPRPWIYRPYLHELRSILTFGGVASATAIMNIAYQMLPQLCLGGLAGLEAAGLYNRAMTLSQLPERAVVSAFQPVLLPAFAGTARSGGDLTGAYLHGLALFSAIQWPVLFCLAILAEPVVEVVLGAQWGEVASLLRIMALGGLALFPAYLTYPMLLALGRVRDTLTASLISLPPSALLVVGAAPFGPRGVALSLSVTGLLQAWVAVALIRRRAPFRWADLLAALRKSAVVALCAAAVPAGLATWTATGIGIGGLCLALAGGAAGWVAGLFLSGHPLWTEVRLAGSQVIPLACGWLKGAGLGLSAGARGD